MLCFVGIIIACVLFIRKKLYALILPIFIITIIAALMGNVEIPQQFTGRPDFSLFMQINFVDSFKLGLLPAIVSLFSVCFFDGTSSILGLISGVTDNDKLKNHYFKRGLIAEAIGSIVSGLAGTSNGVIFIESSGAIQNGAKTGLASVVTAVLCIPILFLAPLISIIPAMATAPTLILVGILMVSHLKSIRIENFEELVAISLIVIAMPFCFSIAAGAAFGILAYALLKLFLGKFNELNPGLICIALCCLGWFALH